MVDPVDLRIKTGFAPNDNSYPLPMGVNGKDIIDKVSQYGLEFD